LGEKLVLKETGRIYTLANWQSVIGALSTVNGFKEAEITF
jgi:hypothetical protein